MGPKIKYPCATCKKNVGPRAALACDTCNLWVHGTEACAGISNQLIALILDREGKNVKYYCPSCESASSDPPSNVTTLDSTDLKSSVANLKSIVDNFSSVITSFSDTLISIQSDISHLKSEVSDIRSSVGRGEVAVRGNAVQIQAEVREQVRELYEREKRKDSIIIRGLSMLLP